ncbi:RHS repeat-associated core domain-containing protein [Trinickia dinghuensis]|uniref:RHS repeat-associated core domain-containing protein n=1 Tax=Trinickia dinghuensis TaxID=2291023 RepID=UPI0015F19726|nr:RHS repeat-associated core domain-containing protein [Trinickia dinghuensis]
MTGISYANGGTTLGNVTYAYDNAGRRTQIGGSVATITLPAALTSATFDANGNLTADGSLGYGWDSRNRLISLTGAATASFAYDATGRRTGKTINGTTTNFLYDGVNVVQELAGGTPSANLLTGLGIDEVFSRTDSLGTRSFVTDALGSTVALTDGSGAVKTSYAYEPYGNTTTSGEVNANSAQYTGRENDGTGLYYYRARYYNPGFSRFVAEDPIGLAGGANPLAYAGGNAISFVDPLGTTRWPDYLTLTVPTPIPFVGISVSLDRYGDVYAGPSLGANLFGSGRSMGAGWTGDSCTPSQSQLDHFLSGWSANSGFGIGTTWSSPQNPGNDDPSRLGGNLQVPGASIGYNTRLFNVGVHW